MQKIVDEEIILRRLSLPDAQPLFALVDSNRPHLRAWLPWVDANVSVNDTRSFIRSTYRRTGQYGLQVGVWYRGELAGVVGYYGIDRFNRSASLGYWLGAWFQGKGVMTRACRAMLHHAFIVEHLNRVEIRSATGNLKSRAIPQRLGFTHEGVARESAWLHERFVDMAVYSLLAREYMAGR